MESPAGGRPTGLQTFESKRASTGTAVYMHMVDRMVSAVHYEIRTHLPEVFDVPVRELLGGCLRAAGPLFMDKTLPLFKAQSGEPLVLGPFLDCGPALLDVSVL